jgi:prepilin-type N-terminal cleavage/methylation domain-containing protein
MRNNNKGFTLAEVILALLITGLVMSAAGAFFVYGYENFGSNIKYVRQQERISDTVERIRKDVEKAHEVTFNTTDCAITFTFKDDSLPETYRFVDNSLTLHISGGAIVTVLDNIDTSQSKFTHSSSYKKLVLTVKPVATNDGKHQGENVYKAITTEFSLQYKIVN